MSEVTSPTDPSGRWFLSYRRVRLDEVTRLVTRLHDRGIPTWQDIKDLPSEPTMEGISRALESPDTAGAILWVTPEVKDSPIMQQAEAPKILKRVKAKDGFAVEFCLAGGVKYSEATAALAMPGVVEDPGAAWNLMKIDGSPATEASIVEESQRVLGRRLEGVNGRLEDGMPLRIAIHAHALSKPPFQLGWTLVLDWTSHFFDLRHAKPESWSANLLPALADIVRAIRERAPGRRVEATGFPTIAAAMAFGRAFMEPAGIRLSWVQLLKEESWSLEAVPVDSGFRYGIEHMKVDATDLAVFVSLRAAVDPAVQATNLPPFRAVLRILPPETIADVAIEGPGQAVHLARLVANGIREARRTCPTIRKTHIFYAGPVGLAVLIGQLLNAVGPVQTYEYQQSDEDGVGRYLPAALLSDAPADRGER